MKIRDKELKETVDVCDRNCLKKSCYWPRPNPGSFAQGRGYISFDKEVWMNASSLILRARAYAKENFVTRNEAWRLERLADHLESIVTEQKRLYRQRNLSEQTWSEP